MLPAADAEITTSKMSKLKYSEHTTKENKTCTNRQIHQNYRHHDTESQEHYAAQNW